MNRGFIFKLWLFSCVISMLGACSDSKDIVPDESVKITLETSVFQLGKGETGALRFSVSPWHPSWNVSQVSLQAAGGGELSEGYMIMGFCSSGDGHFVVYITDDGTADSYNSEVSLNVSLEGRSYTSEKFSLKSSAEGRSELPVIWVDTHDSVPVLDKETWIDGTIKIEGHGLGDLAETDIKVKGRGNSTWNKEKKPYALKFSSKTSVLGMPEHKRWCLLANYMDKTLMRNRLAYYIGAHTSLSWTPRTRFAEVIFNGDTLGNYLVVEQVKIDKNRLNIDEISVDDNEGNAITGGYLLELDSYYDEINKFTSEGSGMPVNIKAPDEKMTYEQFSYIRNYFNEADRLLFDKNFADPSSMFDFTSFADFWIVNELMENIELRHPKSFYIHKPRGGKLFAGPVWDFDFGTLAFTRAEEWSVRNNNIWFTRLLSSEAFRKRARERWRVLYPFLLTVPDYIEQQKAYIAASAERNFDRWPRIINTEYLNEDEQLSFDEAVARLKKSYEVRLAWLNAEIEKW